MARTYGLAGRMAAAFIDSRLTPLVIAASIALGGLAVIALPREEEPQIIVPMVDIFVEMPGATPAEVEHRVTRPMEQLIWEVPGIEYVYSTSSPGRSMVIARFHVGQALAGDAEGAVGGSAARPNLATPCMPGTSSTKDQRPMTCATSTAPSGRKPSLPGWAIAGSSMP